jgi:crotonobetainyl-CoA:carnitine CoA-transferase CaiB-like acyl-CoA transferase
MYAAYGILGALVERGTTGVGRHVEVSMLEAMAHFAVEPFAAYFALGEVPTSRDRPRLAQAHILRTADGGFMAIHLSSLEKFWTGLVAAVGAPELATDPRFATRLARIENYDALGAELDRRFRTGTIEQWVERLGAHDVPAAPINPVNRVVDDPQVRHLGLIVPVDEVKGATHAVRPAVKFDGRKADAVVHAPLIDEHGAAIRRGLEAGLEWPAA